MSAPSEEVIIDYTNWRGQRSLRRIKPVRIIFECNEWHQDTQWILYAFDVERGEGRAFAMDQIHTWFPASKDPFRG